MPKRKNNIIFLEVKTLNVVCLQREKNNNFPLFFGLVGRVVAAVNPTLGPLQLQQQNNLRRRAAKMQKAEIFFGLRSRTRSHTRFFSPSSTLFFPSAYV